jgi:tryptophan 2,3-dioxygenase
MSAEQPKTDYDHYLKIGDLLTLQQPLTPGAHDEVLFIVIHQAFELWFKLILHELDAASASLLAGEPSSAVWPLQRIKAVLELLIQQIAILDTMSPDGFMRFRDPLAPASGFESFQFREIEITLGIRDAANAAHLSAENRGVMERRLGAPSLYAAFCACASAHGLPMPPEPEHRDLRLATLAQIYAMRSEPEVAVFHLLAELMVDIDSAFSRWRFRHVQTAARQIGRRMGTGGTSGVGYLESTLSRRCFEELWDVRSQF